jgi:hypothetical protein
VKITVLHLVTKFSAPRETRNFFIVFTRTLLYMSASSCRAAYVLL